MKMDIPPAVCTANVEEILDAGYKTFIQVYTDWSVDQLHATAAYDIPAFGIHLAEQNNFSNL